MISIISDMSRLCTGIFSLWLLRNQPAGAGRRLVAFEPLPPNQQLLRANLQHAGLWNQVRNHTNHPCCVLSSKQLPGATLQQAQRN